MGDSELDRVDPREIGRVEHMLAPGAALGLLAAERGQGVDHRIEHRHGVDPPLPAFAFQVPAHGRIDEGVEDQAGPAFDILEHAIEMAFGAHHRPEVVERLDHVELGETGLGDHVQSLARGIRQQM